MLKKRLFSVFCVFLLIMGIGVTPAFATGNKNETETKIDINITPRWEDAYGVFPSISKSGTSITASVYIQTISSSVKSSGNLKIEKKVGFFWVTVKTVSFNKTGNVNLTTYYTGDEGSVYRTRVIADVGNDSIDTYSSTVTL